MTRAEFALDMARLAAAYRQDLSQATAEVYFEMLGRFSALDFQAAVTEAIREQGRLPTVADLLWRVKNEEHEREARERQARQPVAAIPAEVGDPAENRRQARKLIDSLKSALRWDRGAQPEGQNATESPERGV